MDFELKAAREKWEREQRHRRDEARARVEREKKAREEALQQQRTLEAAQRLRRLEEAEAALAAQRREEEDLIVGDGIKFNKVLKAVDISAEGDKIRLPPSAFEELSSQGALDKGPMFFQISPVSQDGYSESDEREHTTHAGVLQFTAQEGFVELPSHVWQNCGVTNARNMVNEQVLVAVRYVRLPKGTYAKLLPDVVDFADLPNHKAVLETKLRQHATLSKGDLLSVQFGGVNYGLSVLELKPNHAVSVLETDIEVDVVEATVSNSKRLVVPVTFGKPESGVVDEGVYNYYKFFIDQNLVDAAGKGEVNIVLTLELEGNPAANDADLYVAMYPVLFPTQHQHEWSSHDVGSKVICLTGPGNILQQGFYSVGVHGFRGRSSYKILVQTQSSTQVKTHGQRIGAAVIQSSQHNDSPSDETFHQCNNCKQLVPARTIALHEAFCRRHNVLCQYAGCGVVLRHEEMKNHVHCSICEEVFRQEELEKHMKVYHEPQPCKCGTLLVKEETAKHQAATCPLRMITCKFCGDLVQAGSEVQDLRDRLQGLTQHESICGSRTSPCSFCGRAIMFKEMELHLAAAHSGSSQVGGLMPSSPSVYPGTSEHTEVSATPDTEFALSTKSVSCPICDHAFTGSDSEAQLNLHLDSQHFALPSSSYHSSDVAVSSELSNSSQLRSLSVSCPICGLAVHSERDLSLHIDMVH